MLKLSVEIVPDWTSDCLDWNYLLNLPKLPIVSVNLETAVFSDRCLKSSCYQKWREPDSSVVGRCSLLKSGFFFSWDDQSFEPQTVSQLKPSFFLLEKKPRLCLQSAPAHPTEATPNLRRGKVREGKCHTRWIFFHFKGAWFPGGAEFLTSRTFGAISVYLQAHMTVAST